MFSIAADKQLCFETHEKKNSTLTLHLSTFCFFYFIFILLMGGELLFKCPLLSTHSSDSPPVLSAFQKEGGDCPL